MLPTFFILLSDYIIDFIPCQGVFVENFLANRAKCGMILEETTGKEGQNEQTAHCGI